MRSTLRGLLTHMNRKKWEERIASVLTENKEAEVDTAAKRFERIYKERKFVPVEKGVPLNADGEATLQPEHPYILNVAMLGAQNSGKSSLVNALCHAHLGVESKRSGSTMFPISGVATVHDTQLTLIDTPGIVQVQGPKDRKRHAEAALQSWDTLFAANAVVLTISAGLGFLEPECKSIAREVGRRAAQRKLPLFLAVTMMDKVQTPRQRDMYFSFRAEIDACGLKFAKCHETSVKDSKGLVELKDTLCTYATPGKWKAYRHEPTTMNAKERVSECLRQAFLDNLPHEIPYEMRHRVIGWTAKENGGVEVVVEVFVSRPAYLFTFYSKLEGIANAAQYFAERELKKKFFFVFQGFLTPGEVSSSGR